ncbi:MULTISPECIES: lipocalin family protein [unclassified Dysgonomonas]|uniref:lipocalin family protein n=1 Tax=unclassified Dysgonomonas TaxID=2630389 RepID=UPI000682AD22|nr:MULTISPECIES: lipocalin family protein [unclassified Dysgonomonas]MBD8346359.1 lipocalin family protein [Dysgonomonas sp. HGC4]MBF0574724.1 lipocalin family protein [Dysgonomonas sp. GY617]
MKLKKVVNIFLFALVFGIGFASCSSDDDDNPKPDINPVAGTWKFTELTADVEAVDSLLTDSVTNYIDSMKVAVKRTYVFKMDGTYENNPGDEGEVIKGKYKVDGDKIIFDDKTDSAIAYTFKSDTLKASEDVKAKVAEALKIDPDSIAKAIKVEMFSRISR